MKQYSEMGLYEKSEFEQSLSNAVSTGLINTVKTLFAQCPSKELIQKTLFESVGHGNSQLTNMMLDKGANPNADFYGTDIRQSITPIDTAIATDNIDVALLLLDRGAHPGAALCSAMDYQEPDVLNRFLDHGVDPASNHHEPLRNAARISQEHGIDTYLNVLLVERKLEVDDYHRSRLKIAGYDNALRLLEKRDLHDRQQALRQKSPNKQKKQTLKI